MKLYFSKGACSLVPRIIINELGLPCEFESVDLKTKKTESGKDFLLVNPKGYVPTLVTTSGETLTENAVILQYLADSNQAEQLLPAVKLIERYKVLEWLNFVTTELHKGFGALFNPKIPQEIKETIFIPLLKTKLALVDHHLEQHEFLAANHFTLPDAYMFVIVMWTHHFKFDLNNWPQLSRYFKKLLGRKSIQKSLEQEGLAIAEAE